MRNVRVLISGAGIAGLITAYWLKRYGFRPTVVERAEQIRLGGHAVDLWGSAVEVIERMGLLPAVEASRTGNDIGTTIVPGRRPLTMPLNVLATPIADRHVEIMRGTLVSLLFERAREGVDYLFGDTIRAIDTNADGVRVSFEHASARSFDLVIGADGQHSNVRQLMFGPASQFSRYLGAYLCGFSLPNDWMPPGHLARYLAPAKTVTLAPIRESGDIAAMFLFRRLAELQFQRHDLDRQQQLVREVFAAEGWHVPSLLTRVPSARDFYFSPVSQIRMRRWSQGRIALVGDAGFCPAPAVGGGTTLAIIAAYILAGELARARGDYTAALPNYERAIRPAVEASRDVGPSLVRALIPRTPLEITFGLRLAPLVLRSPPCVRRIVPLLPRRALRGLRQVASVTLPA
ncbi:FAD-dependent monooxygenase [Peristeroidobacter agariperforans]|uniref:FAD-dependent monooxygenase n=1 Tax=Peristeroidobacter agariperforans TaxID=268404 RepID=UPI00101C471F|nr:FAD-dependent monooxygenase [Peristeroidobacter agariperforans]